MDKIPGYTLRDNYKIPALGLGTWKLSGEKCKNAVRKALELGYRHIDTAERYNNELEIGEAIKDFSGRAKEGIFITSKVVPSNLRYNDVLKSCERSLKKLKTPYLDLYLIHWPTRYIPLTETFKAMKKLNEEGKVRSIGVSNFDIALLKKALKVEEVPIAVNQVEFHPYIYQNQKKLLEFCKKNEIIVVAYSPLVRSKIMKDKVIQELSQKYKKTPAQISLRWGLQKEVVVIPKASSENHLKENMEIFDFKLSKEDERMIDYISSEKRYINIGGILQSFSGKIPIFILKKLLKFKS